MNHINGIDSLFQSGTHRGIWMEKWCDTCHHNKHVACPILELARADRKPAQWTRTRSTDMDSTFTCSEYIDRPPLVRRQQAEPEDVPMFELDPHEAHLVPVEGWVDAPRGSGIDHA